MNNKPTIELPRLEGESARAFRARTEYTLMGADRSLDKTRQKLGKSAGYTRVLQEWSSRYGWADLARQYDDQVAYLTVQEASEKYRTDLEAHRTQANQAGDALFTVSAQLIKAINAALAGPRQIKGEDGKIYTIHNMELNANTFSIAARAMQTALDLKAHALGVDRILPSLEGNDSE